MRSTSASAPLRWRRMIRWISSPTGLLATLGAVLIGVGIGADDLWWVSIPGLVVVLLVLVAVATAAAAADARLDEALSTRHAAQSERIEAVANRLTALDQREAAESATRAAALAGLSGRVDDVDARLNGQVAAGTATDAALAAVRSDVADVAKLAPRVAAAEKAAGVLANDIVAERSDRSLLAAHLVDPHLPIKRVLLQMTVHRSGSTRFFDVMRTHSAVRLSSTMEVWDRLGLKGRRYPVAFSDTVGAFVPLEVEFGVGATIPQMRAAPLPAPDPADRWLVEKAHPQFADFDAEGLATRIAEMRDEGTEVVVAFGIRRPLDAMWSMADFKTRQPSWYAHLALDEVPDWILRSLASIEELHALIGGPILDYQDFPSGDSYRQLGSQLAPTWSADQVEQWLQFANEQVAPARREQRSDSGFLGAPNPQRSPGGPDDVWVDLAETVAAADQIYDRLLERQSLHL